MIETESDLAPDTLCKGYRRFKSRRFAVEHDLYEQLSKGQQPHTLVIACSDSRVDPAVIFDCAPGELFVVRNVANLTPEYCPGGVHGVSAALEYAVKVLKVKGVVVLGHRECGGVRACAHGLDDAHSEFLGPWLEVMQPAREEAVQSINGAPDTRLCDRLELVSIHRSVERLKDFPFVAEAIESYGLELHGARFGIASGELEWMRPDGSFETLSDRR
ncbi:carbonic anhydrase [Maricaulis sp.]|uniref:carbonic anhydrase n=1 Tax=Maricaulis sp. TaxID=1486257 RepID=UPI0026284CA3|nr:carbonic anhydrase [Maricaulis sp.]